MSGIHGGPASVQSRPLVGVGHFISPVIKAVFCFACFSSSVKLVNSSRYRINLKYSDRQAWANSVDTDQTPQNAVSDQSLRCWLLIQKF